MNPAHCTHTTQPHSGRSPVVATRFINRSPLAVKSSGVWVRLGKKAIYAITVLGDNGCFYSASFIGTIRAVIRKLPITSVVCGWGHHSRTPWFTTCHKSRLLAVNSGRSSFLRLHSGLQLNVTVVNQCKLTQQAQQKPKQTVLAQPV